MFTKTTLSTLAALALTTTMTAQTYKWETEPVGYKNKAGNWYSTLFGAYANGRMQFTNGNFIFSGRRYIDRIYFRRDYGRKYTRQAGGRSWNNVRLDISKHASFDKTTNWATAARAPSNVFNAKWSMPTRTGTETSLKWTMYLPFRNHWIHYGGGVLMDYRFSGGKLANGLSWGSNYHAYYLDGMSPNGQYPSHTLGQASYYTSRCYVFAGKKVCFWTCLDSSYLPKDPKKTYAQDLEATARVHSDTWTDGTAGTLQLYVGVRYAPKAPVILMTSLSGFSKGVDVGSRCNKLWLNPASAISYQTRTGFPYTRFSSRVKFKDHWAGHHLWFQAGYADSKTRQLSLTTAAKVRLPKKPVDILSRERNAVYHPNVRATKGYGPYKTASYQPLNLFRYK